MLDLAYKLQFGNPYFRGIILVVEKNWMKNREATGDGAVKRREFQGKLICYSGGGGARIGIERRIDGT